MTTRLDGLVDAAISRVDRVSPVRAVTLDPELARPKSFLKVLDADHWNWQADRFRKLFAMRFRVKVPPLDQLNLIFYPEPRYEAPIFIFFCLLTKRKLIAHLNVNCPFDDAAYRERWVEPLNDVLDRYPIFRGDERYPEWMKKYRQKCTIMGMFPRERFDELEACALEYLDHYTSRIPALEPESDPDRLEAIRAFHAGFVDDIRTQDKAQGMISKMIGKEKARRIFWEITT